MSSPADCSSFIGLSNQTATPEVTNVEEMVYRVTHEVVNKYAIPIACIIGIVGNVLNLIIIRRIILHHKHKTSVEDCLMAVAVADLLFCLLAFPSLFLPPDDVYPHWNFLLLYRISCHGLINIFIMASTWLVVALASERFVAICHPFHARRIITGTRTKTVIVLVYICSTLFNFPIFWRFKVQPLNCSSIVGIKFSLPLQVQPTHVLSRQFDYAYRVAWSILGNFLPLVALLFCNAFIIRGIVRSSNSVRRDVGNSCTRRLEAAENTTKRRSKQNTYTLMVIVGLFLVLVAPSEISRAVMILAGVELENHVILTVETIFNFLQTVNFSVNFILYTFVNRTFRINMFHTFQCTGHHQVPKANVYVTQWRDNRNRVDGWPGGDALNELARNSTTHKRVGQRSRLLGDSSLDTSPSSQRSDSSAYRLPQKSSGYQSTKHGRFSADGQTGVDVQRLAGKPSTRDRLLTRELSRISEANTSCYHSSPINFDAAQAGRETRGLAHPNGAMLPDLIRVHPTYSGEFRDVPGPQDRGGYGTPAYSRSAHDLADLDLASSETDSSNDGYGEDESLPQQSRVSQSRRHTLPAFLFQPAQISQSLAAGDSVILNMLKLHETTV